MTMEPDHRHTHEPVPVEERGTGLTGYAAVKYGFIFLIVVAILWFLGAVVLPTFTG